jgi:hypothetical protein
MIHVKPAGKSEAALTVKDGFRIGDEVAVYLSNVPNLAQDLISRIRAASNCSGSPSNKSTSTRSPSKTCKRSTQRY